MQEMLAQMQKEMAKQKQLSKNKNFELWYIRIKPLRRPV